MYGRSFQIRAGERPSSRPATATVPLGAECPAPPASAEPAPGIARARSNGVTSRPSPPLLTRINRSQAPGNWYMNCMATPPPRECPTLVADLISKASRTSRTDAAGDPSECRRPGGTTFRDRVGRWQHVATARQVGEQRVPGVSEPAMPWSGRPSGRRLRGVRQGAGRATAPAELLPVRFGHHDGPSSLRSCATERRRRFATTAPPHRSPNRETQAACEATQPIVSNRIPFACSRASRLSPIACAVVTCPAVVGLSSKARQSADSASILAVSS